MTLFSEADFQGTEYQISEPVSCYEEDIPFNSFLAAKISFSPLNRVLAPRA
jgi:hypothetical protein